MALSLADAPKHGFEVVNRNAEPAGDGELESFGSTPTFIARPQPLYTADIDQIGKDLLGSAKLTGWDYVIFTKKTPQAVMELALSPESPEGLSFAMLHPQQSAQHLVRAIADAERIADKSGLSYDLRLLRVPEVYLLAVWLAGERNLLLPVRPKTSGLKGKRVFSESELSAALLPLARQRSSSLDREVIEETPVQREKTIRAELERRLLR